MFSGRTDAQTHRERIAKGASLRAVGILLLVTLLLIAAPASPKWVTAARAQTFEQLQRNPQLTERPRLPKMIAPKRVEREPPRRAPSASPPPRPPIEQVAKLPDAKTIMVIGDFLGAELAAGLSEAYAQSPGAVVDDKTNGSSGFARDDFYNWPTQIGALIESEKPSVVVVMIGANDRQQIAVNGKKEAIRSDEWTKAYEARIDAFAKAVADRHIPLVWVGTPAFRSSAMTTDMLAFNDIYQHAAEREKAAFVDIWDGFVNDNGAFTITGPDVNGQPTRLRLDDGVNFSRAGKMKVAFYARKEIDKILGDAVSPDVGTLKPDTSLPSGHDLGTGAALRTPPIPLQDQGIDNVTALDGETVMSTNPGESAIQKLTTVGLASKAWPGRADDFGGVSQMPSPARAGDEDQITRIIQESGVP